MGNVLLKQHHAADIGYYTISDEDLKKMGPSETAAGKTTIMYRFTAKCVPCEGNNCSSSSHEGKFTIEAKLEVRVLILIAENPQKKGKDLAGKVYTTEGVYGHEQMHAFHMLEAIRGKELLKHRFLKQALSIRKKEKKCYTYSRKQCEQALHGKDGWVRKQMEDKTFQNRILAVYKAGSKHVDVEKEDVERSKREDIPRQGLMEKHYGNKGLIKKFIYDQWTGWAYVYAHDPTKLADKSNKAGNRIRIIGIDE